MTGTQGQPDERADSLSQIDELAEYELRPKAGARQSRGTEDLLSVTFVRPCKSPEDLRPEVIRQLKKKRFKIQPQAMLPDGLDTGILKAITALRGKRLVVAMISREGNDCLVTLTVTTK